MKYAPPLSQEALGEDAHYTDGNPELGILGSIVPAASIEQGQREIVNAIRGAGLEPSAEDLSQLLKAMIRLIGMNVPLATTEIAGMVQIGRGLGIASGGCVEVKPDPATLALNAAGQITALGGNLAYNEEVWILASGTFTAPVTGWYDVLTFGGGGNGTVGAYFAGSSVKLASARTGAMHGGTVHLCQGEEVEVVIGAGAPPGPAGNSASSKDGGATSFGNKTLAYLGRMSAEIRVYSLNNASRDITLSGIGLDGGYPSAQPASISQSEKNAYCNAVGHFGGSGAVRFTTISDYGAGAGAQGSVRLRYWNPDKANG